MNSKYVKAELAATKFKQVASVVQGIIDELGGCDKFAYTTKEAWAAAFNRTHPVKPGKKAWGFGRGIEEGCVYARNVILGRTDDARMEAKVSEEVEKSRVANDRTVATNAVADVMRTTRVQLKVMADAISWLSQVETEDTLEGVMNAYRKLSGKREA